VSRTAAAFADDCTRAALIVTVRPAPVDCAARVIDRAMLRKNGAMALTWRNGRFETASARPDGIDRPWTRHHEAGRAAAPADAAVGRAPPAAPRDATPLRPDVDAER
jgi:competence protein ComEC